MRFGLFAQQRIDPCLVDGLSHGRIPDPPVPRRLEGVSPHTGVVINHPGSQDACQLGQVHIHTATRHMCPCDKRMHD